MDRPVDKLLKSVLALDRSANGWALGMCVEQNRWCGAARCQARTETPTYAPSIACSTGGSGLIFEEIGLFQETALRALAPFRFVVCRPGGLMRVVRKFFPLRLGEDYRST